MPTHHHKSQVVEDLETFDVQHTQDERMSIPYFSNGGMAKTAHQSTSDFGNSVHHQINNTAVQFDHCTEPFINGVDFRRQRHDHELHQHWKQQEDYILMEEDTDRSQAEGHRRVND